MAPPDSLSEHELLADDQSDPAGEMVHSRLLDAEGDEGLWLQNHEVAPVEYQGPRFSPAPELTLDRRSRLLRWLLTPKIRRRCLLLTTLAVGVFAVWLLFAGLDASGGSEPSATDADQAATAGEIQSTESDDPEATTTVRDQSEVINNEVSTVESADGALTITIDPPSVIDGVSAIRRLKVEVNNDEPRRTVGSVLLVRDGTIIDQDGAEPFEFVFDTSSDATGDSDPASSASVVSVVVEWLSEDGEPPIRSAPATLVIANP